MGGVDSVSLALESVAARNQLEVRTAAALKVTAARLGEEVMGECMHILRGSGYLSEERPVGRWWADMKHARVGGGIEEVLWELVAAGMKADFQRTTTHRDPRRRRRALSASVSTMARVRLRRTTMPSLTPLRRPTDRRTSNCVARLRFARQRHLWADIPQRLHVLRKSLSRIAAPPLRPHQRRL
jgi:hypothetical protein